MSLRLTEKDRKVLEAFTAKNGVSNIPMAGIWLEENRKFSISRRSLYNIVSKLVKMQYLRKLPGDTSPAAYEPGVMCYKEKKRAGAKNGAKSSVVATGDSPIYPAPYPLDGVVVAKECPDGYGALHLNGSMSLTVSKEGSFDEIQIGNLNVGRWKPEHGTPGAVNRSGEIDIDGQRITFNFRRGINTGNLSFSLRPAAFAIKEDLPNLPKGLVRLEPYEVFDDKKKIIVQRKPTTVKTETELWFMAASGYSVPQCAREWGIKVTTLKDYLRGRTKEKHRYEIPERLTRYRELTERVRDGKVSGMLPIPDENPDGKVVADE